MNGQSLFVLSVQSTILSKKLLSKQLSMLAIYSGNIQGCYGGRKISYASAQVEPMATESMQCDDDISVVSTKKRKSKARLVHAVEESESEFFWRNSSFNC
jgi:hypothetical protein